MDENGIDRKPESIQVSLASSDYELVAGGSTDVEVLLENKGPSDYFVVNLLGIPAGWVKYSGQPVTWLESGGRERVVLSINPPATDEGILGSYPGRLYVFAQSAPDKGREVPVILKVVPPEKTKKTFALRAM